MNYNQRQLNAFAGLVSLLPAVDGRVFCLSGGNSQLPQRLLERANATMALASAVEHVERAADGQYTLTTVSSDGATSAQHGPFDAVVIATPLEQAGLAFSGVELPVIPAREFQVRARAVRASGQSRDIL